MRPLRDSSALVDDGPALAERIAADGYLFIAGLLPAADILALRRRMLDVVDRAGWIRRAGPDDDAAIAEPTAFHLDTDPETTAVVIAQAALPEVQALLHHRALVGLFERLFGEPVLALPRIIVRDLFPQQDDHTTPAHQDYPHVQGSRRTCAAWIPVGDCDASMGGVQMAEGSHRDGVLPIEPALGAGGLGVADVYTGRWRYSPFAAGDVVIFNCLTVHKGFGYGAAAMGGLGAGQSTALAWPSADFNAIPLDSGIQAAYRGVLEAADDPAAEQARLEAELGALCGAFPAAEQVKIDDIIEPRETRPRLIQALERALSHRAQAPVPCLRTGFLP